MSQVLPASVEAGRFVDNVGKCLRPAVSEARNELCDVTFVGSGHLRRIKRHDGRPMHAHGMLQSKQIIAGSINYDMPLL